MNGFWYEYIHLYCNVRVCLAAKNATMIVGPRRSVKHKLRKWISLAVACQLKMWNLVTSFCFVSI